MRRGQADAQQQWQWPQQEARHVPYAPPPQPQVPPPQPQVQPPWQPTASGLAREGQPPKRQEGAPSQKRFRRRLASLRVSCFKAMCWHGGLRWVGRPPEPCGRAAGLALRTWREHVVCSGRALRASCFAPPSAAVALRYPCVPAGRWPLGAATLALRRTLGAAPTWVHAPPRRAGGWGQPLWLAPGRAGGGGGPCVLSACGRRRTKGERVLFHGLKRHEPSGDRAAPERRPSRSAEALGSRHICARVAPRRRPSGAVAARGRWRPSGASPERRPKSASSALRGPPLVNLAGWRRHRACL